MTPADPDSWTPGQVQILLTERCNLVCRHCAVPQEDSPAEEELDEATWRRFISVLVAGGVDSIVFSGGEALLRREAVALALHAHDLGIARTTLVSNGLLFTEPVAAEIAEAQRRFPDFGVHVSIDGASATTHDWMRGAGTFDRTFDNLARLAAAGGRITGVHTVFHTGNAHEFEAMVELVASLEVDVWTVFPVAALGRAVEIPEARLDAVTWKRILARIDEVQRTYGLDVGVMGPIMGDEWPNDAPTIPGSRSDHSLQTCVGPDGAVFTCPPLRDLAVGRVDVVVESGDWAAVAARVRDVVQTACSTCKFLLLCTGVDLGRPLRPSPAGQEFGLPHASIPVALATPTRRH